MVISKSDGSVGTGSQMKHKVRMDKEYYEKISTGIIGPVDFVKKSFEFLLKREVNIKQLQLVLKFTSPVLYTP